ncbi:hypothetical protein SRHO_G00135410 [Serrasalmus rhombeus]
MRSVLFILSRHCSRAEKYKSQVHCCYSGSSCCKNGQWNSSSPVDCGSTSGRTGSTSFLLAVAVSPDNRILLLPINTLVFPPNPPNQQEIKVGPSAEHLDFSFQNNIFIDISNENQRGQRDKALCLVFCRAYSQASPHRMIQTACFVRRPSKNSTADKCCNDSGPGISLTT